MKTILMVDDYAIVSAGMEFLLQNIGWPMSFCAANNRNDAMKRIQSLGNIDLVILSASTPDYSCEQLMSYCRLNCPAAKILIFSVNSEQFMARHFYKLGADGYLSKRSDDATIKKVIVELLEGRKYYSQEFLRQLAIDTLEGKQDVAKNPLQRLSNRELEVLEQLVEGKTIQEIAQAFSINASTIATYKSRIFEKLNVDNMISLYKLYTLNCRM